MSAPRVQPADAAFLDAINAAGLEFTGPIIADSGLQRFKVNGDRAPNSWYVLHTDGLPAGRFGCNKRQIDQGWCYKSASVLTDEERAERDRRWKQQQAEREADRQRQNNEASAKAAAILEAAQPATDDHPYLVKKGVKAAPGVLVGTWIGKPNCLLIPLSTASGQLATIQAISPDAPFTHSGQSKDFLKGGAKQGAYFVIGDLADSPIILVAEGYATAATLHEATGYAAVMACDTGGLTPVTQVLKTLYPYPKVILICADNDRKTEGNPGAKAARAAAKKVGVRLAIPEFAEDEVGSDYNDLATLHGADRVWNEVESALAGQRWKATQASPPRAKATPGDQGDDALWRLDLIRRSDSDQLLKNHYNAVMVVDHALPGLIGYNEFRQRIEARIPTPWGKQPGIWNEEDTGELAVALTKEFASFSIDMLNTAIMVVAHRHPFNPAQDRLRELAEQWDGVNRLDSWLVDFLNAGNDASNEDYVREIGAAWMKGIAARVLFPGCKRDDVLVLRGPQGWMKSTAAQCIADCIHPDSFTDHLGDLGSKDAKSAIRGILIAELGELAALNKSDIESVKAFVAGRSDHFREAYGRGERDYPRTVSFIGTTNDPTFLKDPSGNRRWWPITLTAPIDIPRFQDSLPQILGEAASKVLAGEKWFVHHALALTQADEVRAGHYAEDVWTEAALNAANRLLQDKPPTSRYVTIAEVMSAMGLKIEQQTVPASMRIGNILRVNQWESRRKRIGPRSENRFTVAWYHPETGSTLQSDTKEPSQTAEVPWYHPVSPSNEQRVKETGNSPVSDRSSPPCGDELNRSNLPFIGNRVIQSDTTDTSRQTAGEVRYHPAENRGAPCGKGETTSSVDARPAPVMPTVDQWGTF